MEEIYYHMAELSSLVKAHEGLRVHPYFDSVHVLTIGHGRNLSTKGISPAEADYLLRNDLHDATMELLQFSWFSGMNAPRQACLIDMMLNLGASRFREFARLHAALEAQDYGAASGAMLDSEWAKEVGKRAHEDAEMMLRGVWL